ncbi:hypothetical protein DSO57_1019393 [Entomophthora muscae]|uniref:Uncharacterized protein n=1 Tax=Entomophthora muscae TaxID=34485 RepID=A0ACC2UDB3_9FUNG|nr:hypothetical protein DSO57_1019393 [Entomophthora muscae]
MELRSKSRGKRPSSTKQPDTSADRPNPPQEPSPSESTSTHIESTLDSKRIKIQNSPNSNTSRYLLRQKLNKDQSPSPRITSPRSKPRSGASRNQVSSLPVPIPMNNCNLSNQSSIVSGGISDSGDSLVEGFKAKKEISKGRPPPSAEACEEPSKSEGLSRNSQAKRRPLQSDPLAVKFHKMSRLLLKYLPRLSHVLKRVRSLRTPRQETYLR